MISSSTSGSLKTVQCKLESVVGGVEVLVESFGVKIGMK